MTVKIRQEINFINREFVNPTGDADLSEIIAYDPANYNGETVYLEVVAKNTDGSNVLYVNLHDSSNNEHESLTVPTSTSSYTLIRSAIDTTLDADEYHIYLEDNTATWATNGSIKLARLVILQSAESITDTQTQIEVGAYQSKASPAAANTWYALDEPKYWKYESAKWNPTPTFTFGLTHSIENDKSTITYGLEVDDGSFNWSGTVVGQISSTSETITYDESSAFTPTDGYHYRVVWKTNNTMYGADIYNAKVVATQKEHVYYSYLTGIAFPVQGDGGSNEAQTFDFDSGDGGELTALKIGMSKAGSPTDNVYCVISTTKGGSAITNGTSQDFACSGLSTSSNLETFTFSTNPTLDADTTYFVHVYRDGTRDNTNYPILICSNDVENGDPYPDFDVYGKDNDVWDSSGNGYTPRAEITVAGQTEITKFQTEYLLINEAQTGTGLQEFLTDFVCN